MSAPPEADLAARLAVLPPWAGPDLAFRAALRVLPLAQAPGSLAADDGARREALAVLRDLILAEALLALPRPLPPYPRIRPDSPPPDPILAWAGALVVAVEGHSDRGLAVPAQPADGPSWAACWAGSAASSAAASASAAVGLGAWTDPVRPAVQAVAHAANAAAAVHVPWFPQRDAELLGKGWSPAILRHQHRRLGPEAPARAETAAAAQWAAAWGDLDGGAAAPPVPDAAMLAAWAGPVGAFWRRWWRGHCAGPRLPAGTLRAVARIPAAAWCDGLAGLAPHLPEVPD